tara:strand:- start:245 stop:769 length:525 start_codon:yes stop_codon:yes gene_type:complete
MTHEAEETKELNMAGMAIKVGGLEEKLLRLEEQAQFGEILTNPDVFSRMIDVVREALFADSRFLTVFNNFSSVVAKLNDAPTSINTLHIKVLNPDFSKPGSLEFYVTSEENGEQVMERITSLERRHYDALFTAMHNTGKRYVAGDSLYCDYYSSTPAPWYVESAEKQEHTDEQA